MRLVVVRRLLVLRGEVGQARALDATGNLSASGQDALVPWAATAPVPPGSSAPAGWT